jgi:hypothetical protein
MLSEHWKAQEMSHYRNKEDARLFYTKTFNQSQDHEQQFLENAILMERARISHDQMSRILLGQIRASSNALPQGLTVAESASTHVSNCVAKTFASTKLHEDCKQAIREMVLRNPIEFMFMKSVKNYISRFVVHPLCPMEGISIDERVSCTNVQYVDLFARLTFSFMVQIKLLEEFDNDAGNLLQKYHSGQVAILKKKIKDSIFGSADAKKIYSPLLQGEDIHGTQVTKGIFEEEEQRNLFARCYLEKVSFLFLYLSNDANDPTISLMSTAPCSYACAR